jgi:hypothetical protein
MTEARDRCPPRALVVIASADLNLIEVVIRERRPCAAMIWHQRAVPCPEPGLQSSLARRSAALFLPFGAASCCLTPACCGVALAPSPDCGSQT